jgi:hypothetical protein
MRIATAAREHGFTSVIAPSHYLSSPRDREFQLDVSLAQKLRGALDSLGLTETSIYYSLALPATSLRDADTRAIVIHRLMRLDIDAVWLRLHPFGSNSSGPVALRRYLTICEDLQRLQVPLVAERAGTVGVALLAFGAVGGMECGVTLGERFDAGRLTRASKGGDPFAHPPMVYLQAIGQYAEKRVARDLLRVRAMKAALGCRDGSCCRNGPEDMLRDPRRHGVIQRIHEVNALASVPPHDRASQYVETVIRRGSDIAVRLGSQHPVIDKARRRLDSWRGTLSAVLEQGGGKGAAAPALGGRVRRLRAPARPRSV